jgi:hypothetical protein
MKSINAEIQSQEKLSDTIEKAHATIKYMIACAHTEQVPFADHQTAELLRDLEVLKDLAQSQSA